jgi:hypothetical protein
VIVYFNNDRLVVHNCNTCRKLKEIEKIDFVACSKLYLEYLYVYTVEPNASIVVSLAGGQSTIVLI